MRYISEIAKERGKNFLRMFLNIRPGELMMFPISLYLIGKMTSLFFMSGTLLCKSLIKLSYLQEQKKYASTKFLNLSDRQWLNCIIIVLLKNFRMQSNSCQIKAGCFFVFVH